MRIKKSNNGSKNVSEPLNESYNFNTETPLISIPQFKRIKRQAPSTTSDDLPTESNDLFIKFLSKKIPRI